MKIQKIKNTLLLVAFIALVIAGSGISNNISAQRNGQNGTTLAAYKTLEICAVGNGMWRYSGEISVWNEGAIDTQGFIINDFIEYKPGNKWLPGFNIPISGITEIPAGTTQETALIFPYSYDGGPLSGFIRNTASLTILNHSGQLGKAFGPSPKATYEGPNPPPPCNNGGGCVYTIGYWGTHRDNWVGGYSPTNTFYLSPYTWGGILPNTNDGPNSSGYYQLARQYIAAQLNAANGAPVPSGVQTILTNSANFFATTNPAVSCNGTGAASCPTQKTWAAVLDSYNNGLYPDGPQHCD